MFFGYSAPLIVNGSGLLTIQSTKFAFESLMMLHTMWGGRVLLQDNKILMSGDL